jgi:LacI family transcriptional regulator
MHGRSYVSADVMRRVNEAVMLLKYEPNEVARSLRGARTNSIGAVFPQIANPYFSRCVQQIELEATRQGSSVILLTHQEDPERQSKQLAVLRRARADGVILSAAPGTDMEKLRQEVGQMPIVALDRPLWDDADVIMLQHREAGRQATLHLLEHGSREIACVTASPTVYSFHERIIGYRQAMEGAGLEAQIIASFDYGALETSIGEGLRLRPHLDALLSLSSMATVAALKAMQRVERRIALIGFDDVELATLVNRPLTVMVQPTEMMARDSVDLLFRRIQGKGGPAVQRIQSAGQLIVRQSCGCLVHGDDADRHR